MSNTITINSLGKQSWQVKEEVRAVNLMKFNIEILGNGPETSEVKHENPDYFESNGNLYYFQTLGNNESFNIGELELPYIREESNRSYRNERSVELGVFKWFIEKFNNDVFEIGDVSCHYSFFKDHKILDPHGPYIHSIRKDVMDYDYTNLNVVSISCFEHFTTLEYSNNSDDLAIHALNKVVKESKNFLVSIPIGVNRILEKYIKDSKLQYTFMVRDSKRGETNNWGQQQNDDLFQENYLHFDYQLDYYGSAGVVCFISNQQELFI